MCGTPVGRRVSPRIFLTSSISPTSYTRALFSPDHSRSKKPCCLWKVADGQGTQMCMAQNQTGTQAPNTAARYGLFTKTTLIRRLATTSISIASFTGTRIGVGHCLCCYGRRRSSGQPRDLVAGCGTSQAAALALREPEARVTAIDISETSLRHTRELKQKYGLQNLGLHRLAIERPGRSGQVFDEIVCTGCPPSSRPGYRPSVAA